jgi:hypothetical protein
LRWFGVLRVAIFTPFSNSSAVNSPTFTPSNASSYVPGLSLSTASISWLKRFVRE